MAAVGDLKVTPNQVIGKLGLEKEPAKSRQSLKLRKEGGPGDPGKELKLKELKIYWFVSPNVVILYPVTRLLVLLPGEKEFPYIAKIVPI